MAAVQDTLQIYAPNSGRSCTDTAVLLPLTSRTFSTTGGFDSPPRGIANCELKQQNVKGNDNTPFPNLVCNFQFPVLIALRFGS